MGEVKLKNCPFCGGRAYIAQSPLANKKFYIDCNHTESCLARPNIWLHSDKPLEQQILAWNKRGSETVVDAAFDVIHGKYGDGYKRKLKLKEAGFDPKRVQDIVNDILEGERR